MSFCVKRRFFIVLLVALLGFSSCGDKFVEEIKLFSTLKDGGKIYVDVEIIVQNEKDLELVRKKTKKFKRAFYIVISEYTSDDLFAKGKRALIKVIGNVLSYQYPDLKKKYNVTNFKLVLKE